MVAATTVANNAIDTRLLSPCGNHCIRPDKFTTFSRNRCSVLRPLPLGFVLDPASIIGLKTARRVNAGQLLSQHLLTQQLLVEKGAQVLIRAEKSGFAASTKGLALEDGRLGQRIKVRNLSSGAELEVEVVAEATVQTFF